jgi:hypothetical protein
VRSNPYVSLVPWVVFSLVENRTGYSPKWAALAALLAALVIALPSFMRGFPKLLDIAGITIFVALTLAAFAVDAGSGGIIADYGRAIAVGLLSVFVFVTLPFMPFTEQYARESVPEEYWDTPQFKKTNRVFSAAWGAVFAAMAVCHVIAGTDATNRHVSLFFNWLIPIGFIIIMVKFMDYYREEHTGGGGIATRGSG